MAYLALNVKLAVIGIVSGTPGKLNSSGMVALVCT
jgi:hypothetical protein